MIAAVASVMVCPPVASLRCVFYNHRARDVTALLTSALRLTSEKAERLKQAGLDHVQISIQAADSARSDWIAGPASFQRKREAARTGSDRTT
jgi:MoaA/NifB/PqqE/SkfB family radical SAM enzyme